MVFTKSDIDYLRNELYENEDEDIDQVARAADKTKYTLYDKSEYDSAVDEYPKGRRISRDSAIAILGRETFLSGLDRSAFHCDAMRESLDGKYYVSFDSHAFFRD